MAKPTKTALERKPAAVIMLASKVDEPDVVGNYDFEWFETPEGRAEYWEAVKTWCAEDVRDHGDLVHVLVNVSDTKAMTIVSVEVFGATDKVSPEWIYTRINDIKADPTLVVAPGPVRANGGGGKKVTPKAKAQVRGRKASTAAAVVKGVVEGGNAPTPKAKAVRKRSVKAKTEDADTKAAALKERLKAKQATPAAEVGKATPTVVAKIDKEEAATPEVGGTALVNALAIARLVRRR